MYSFLLLGRQGTGLVTKSFSFSQPVLDSELSFVRASAALYRAASGELTSAASNVARVDYTLAGELQGMLIEPASTNKMTDRNCNPTDLTGWTKGGDAASSLSVVVDPAGYLAGRKMTGHHDQRQALQTG